MAKENNPGEVVLDGIVQACDGLASILALVCDQVATAIVQIGPLVVEEYQKAGQPYGPTAEGIWRWLKEKGEILQEEREN